jgi:hypothetical protein
VRHYGRAVLHEGVKVAGFTLLRLTPEMVDTSSPLFAQLCRFVRLMSNLKEVCG